MKSINTLSLKYSLAAYVSLASLLNGADFSWNTSSDTNWSIAANWLEDGGATVNTPGASDNVVTPTLFGDLRVNLASVDVASWTYNSSSDHEIVGLNGASGANLGVTGTLTKSGSGTLLFRNGGTQLLNLTVGSLLVDGGTLNLGTFNSTTLNNFTAGSGSVSNASVGLNITSGTANVTGNLALNGSATVSVQQRVGASGTLAVGSLSSTGSSNVIQANSFSGSASTGTLQLNNASGTSTYGGLIESGGPSSVMNVVKNGAGTQIFTGANTYNGTTTVNAGTLLINNTTGSGTGTSTVQVNNGAIFGGSGSSTGDITVANGATLISGDGSAASDGLSLSGDLSLSDGSTLSIALGSSGASSALERTGGTWSFDSDQTFLFLDLGAETGTYNNIISGLTGSETGLASIGTWTISNNGWLGTFSYNGAGSVDLALTTIPEPSMYASMAGFAVVLCVMLRRRFTQKVFI
ncbi:autotransporter-associated beta strand repeat-containing protein [Rubellicoccus peritrichatus]|uniref:Autotransporter-associated beta strand repeat-containing protein n=1 Tax=Rubellicoccus peritrichatus TaxID=3080537 RepID=A0AAQ3LDY7_9BACT|nr:autotransporter-associated beta strand repeat-containing protein [Puniceicoccus sp. CR14]WOO43617.1 autotransporter-associated beta strand repeat-containing protein [Puniceicoccus sp. CR14]